MTVLVVAPGSAGDVHPNVGLALALSRRGHQVILAAAAVFEPLARRVGLPFVGTEPKRIITTFARGLAGRSGNCAWREDGLKRT